MNTLTNAQRRQRRQNMTDEEWLEVPHPQHVSDEEWIEIRTLTINWAALSENPAAIHLLDEEWPEARTINWAALSENPDAIHLLSRINRHEQLFRALMKYMYHPTHEQMFEEIVMCVYHPQRIQQWIDHGNDIEDYLQ